MTLKDFKKLSIGSGIYYLGGEIGIKINDKEIEFPNEIFLVEEENDLVEMEPARYDSILEKYVTPMFVMIEDLKKIKCDYYTVESADINYEFYTWFSSNDIMRCVNFCKTSKLLQKEERWFIIPHKFNEELDIIEFLETYQ